MNTSLRSTPSMAEPNWSIGQMVAKLSTPSTPDRGVSSRDRAETTLASCWTVTEMEISLPSGG